MDNPVSLFKFFMVESLLGSLEEASDKHKQDTGESLKFSILHSIANQNSFRIKIGNLQFKVSFVQE